MEGTVATTSLSHAKDGSGLRRIATAIAIATAGAAFAALALGSASCGGPMVPTAPKKATVAGAELRPVSLDAFAGGVIERACASTGPELCFNARDDNCNGIIDEGCGVSTGIVQFAIAWEEESAQVDLLVTDPSGVLIETGVVSESGLMRSETAPRAVTGRISRTYFSLAGALRCVAATK